ncbi:winged helix-turn-helix domain-containing protein [Vulcanisaeta souniana]|uniref:ArnR1-like winged helix-turn-helix domain-containing protein n=1 Tax=Vulcanisaeta souniana JCM 11219 TaxID=1293586 RepID=A0A830EBT1_9CREN|nr:winged helix-turn-helix domain-containing protein [Vulcanisaeta souniana]BDR91960.1 hypothetical protein Vsou_10530 [Vulcanisaeta souniana JCM 11219]GGI69045.1 hypothetical protein GCM10007112_02510 [Vulcanisaeta souniana JCM 11219]
MMYRKRPRTRIEIYADIMLSLDRMGNCDRLSRLAMMVGVPYDRLIRYLNELKSLGLIRWDSSSVYLSKKGMELLVNSRGARDELVLALTGLIQGSIKTIT